ncbi:endolytic transglycosylase MltG [Salipaludibacillus sp. LMS25]|jgi:TolA-binding protein|uniref:endolytic transglycosylase MltG n=1 Tax=Salipaludibacillus sp. LMS25 TaxID=2924031 RepID=UPI0020D09953|nr:endolytic transglycosylase MltG [Salipaludibacillus sp. LMS25]UTR16126.1 endolytic transglycosylase MltG [Salipaludibacillus sp. LMS25]
MTRSKLRSTAVGLLIATIALAPFIIFADDNSEAATDEGKGTEKETAKEASQEVDESEVLVTEQDMLQYIEENDLVAITSNKFEELQADIDRLSELEEELADLQEENGSEEDEADEGEADEASSSDDDDVHRLYLVIGSGMSAGEIAEVLEETNIISNASDFRDYIENNDLESAIKSGQFMLDSTMSVSEIVGKIT